LPPINKTVLAPLTDDQPVLTPFTDDRPPLALMAGPAPEPQEPARWVALDPHRGAVILTLGICSAVAAVLSFIILFCSFLFPVFPLIAIICGWTARSMANNDLASMRRGEMDPLGRGITQAGQICAIIGSVLALIPFAVFLFYAFLLFGGLLSVVGRR